MVSLTLINRAVFKTNDNHFGKGIFIWTWMIRVLQCHHKYPLAPPYEVIRVCKNMLLKEGGYGRSGTEGEVFPVFNQVTQQSTKTVEALCDVGKALNACQKLQQTDSLFVHFTFGTYGESKSQIHGHSLCIGINYVLVTERHVSLV